MASREEREKAALDLFLRIGLDSKTAQTAASGNVKFRDNLIALINEAGVQDGCEKSLGNLLYTTASKYPLNAVVHRPALLSYLTSKQISTIPQLEAAFKLLRSVGAEPLSLPALNAEAGVGVTISPPEMAAAVDEVIAANRAALEADRYHFNTSILLGKLKSGSMKWADAPALKAMLEEHVASLLGPKTDADLKPPEKKKKEKKPKAPPSGGGEGPGPAPAPPSDPYTIFPTPQQNNGAHTTVNFSWGERLTVSNTQQQLEAHLGRTEGRVVTRFPPEPNGYLHIGHAKAMFVDFGMAERYDGVCYLRFDDTNPEAEKQEYIDHIQDIASWMGWKPWKITYSSDYFQQLYDLAVKLIQLGHAFVCHQTGDEIKAYREQRKPSPWRDRPPAESLAWFDDMRRGLVDEGAATLRMKQDVRNENYNMFDLIAYRIKFSPHPHAGDGWCVYPSYDFTHCIVDSLEDITHSLCTLEFESRRASYYWLLQVLGLYKPFVWEYSRLEVSNNVMSKRKLNQLVTDGHVSGWDDPRLLTLAGLRRRGVPPAAINNFCREVGVTRSDAEVPLHRLDHHIRLEMEKNAPRSLAVLRPLKLVLSNLPEDHFEEVEGRVYPQKKDGPVETYPLPLTRIVYIEADDFREQDDKNFYGAAPGKVVMLKYGHPVRITGCHKEGGSVVALTGELDRAYTGRIPKGVLNWVGCPQPGRAPATAEVRLYSTLFKSANPLALKDDWLSDLNPDSLRVVQGAMCCPALAAAQVGDRFQLERLGYFAVDEGSKPGAMVLNRVVTLKESVLVRGTVKGGAPQ